MFTRKCTCGARGSTTPCRDSRAATHPTPRLHADIQILIKRHIQRIHTARALCVPHGLGGVLLPVRQQQIGQHLLHQLPPDRSSYRRPEAPASSPFGFSATVAVAFSARGSLGSACSRCFPLNAWNTSFARLALKPINVVRIVGLLLKKTAPPDGRRRSARRTPQRKPPNRRRIAPCGACPSARIRKRPFPVRRTAPPVLIRQPMIVFPHVRQDFFHEVRVVQPAGKSLRSSPADRA